MLLYAGPSILTTVACLALTIWACRGKRIDRHPVCRACRYDLHGLDLDTLPDCPECGTQIVSRKDLRRGNRQPRKALAYTFGLLCSLGLLTSIATTTHWASNYDWNRIKPVSWLIDEASDPSQPNTMDAALTELERREDNGLFSYDRRMALVAAALDYQADKSKAWDERWGTFVARARKDGICSQADWERHIAQTADFELLVRERINEGEPFVLSGRFVPPFRGSNYIGQINLYTDDALHTVRHVQNGKAIDPPVIEFHEHYGFGTRYFTDTHSQGFDTLAPGTYEITVIAMLRGGEPDMNPTGGGFSDLDYFDIKPLELTARFEVFPKDVQLVNAIHDPMLAHQAKHYMQHSLATTSSTGRAKIYYSVNSKKFFVEYVIPSPNIPYPCSFDVEIYTEGQKNEFVETVVLEPVATGSHSYRMTNFRLPEAYQTGHSPDNPPTLDKFTMRLVPNPEHLKRELDGYDYLDHVIEIKDIPIAPYQP